LSNGITGNVSTAVRSTQSMAHSVISAASILNDMSLTSPGDMLTEGFNRAYGAISNVVSAVGSIAGSTLGVNGQVNANGNTTVSSTPFTGGATPSTGVAGMSNTANQSTSDNSIIIEAGAIQMNGTGNSEEDGETVARKLENYLSGLRERQG